jgi:hypothetical protein
MRLVQLGGEKKNCVFGGHGSGGLISTLVPRVSCWMYRVETNSTIASQQLTTGVEYLVTVKIARTKCKRDEVKNVSCSLQNNKLKRVGVRVL